MARIHCTSVGKARKKVRGRRTYGREIASSRCRYRELGNSLDLCHVVTKSTPASRQPWRSRGEKATHGGGRAYRLENMAGADYGLDRSGTPAAPREPCDRPSPIAFEPADQGALNLRERSERRWRRPTPGRWEGAWQDVELKEPWFPCWCRPDHANTYARTGALGQGVPLLLGMTRYLGGPPSCPAWDDSPRAWHPRGIN